MGLVHIGIKCLRFSRLALLPLQASTFEGSGQMKSRRPDIPNILGRLCALYSGYIYIEATPDCLRVSSEDTAHRRQRSFGTIWLATLYWTTAPSPMFELGFDPGFLALRVCYPLHKPTQTPTSNL